MIIIAWVYCIYDMIFEIKMYVSCLLNPFIISIYSGLYIYVFAETNLEFPIHTELRTHYIHIYPYRN